MIEMDRVLYRDSSGNWCAYQRKQYFDKLKRMSFRKLKTEIAALKKCLSTNIQQNEYIDRTNKIQASYRLAAILAYLDRLRGYKTRENYDYLC